MEAYVKHSETDSVKSQISPKTPMEFLIKMNLEVDVPIFYFNFLCREH